MVTYAIFSVFAPTLLHIYISIKRDSSDHYHWSWKKGSKLLILIFSDFCDGCYSKVFNKI